MVDMQKFGTYFQAQAALSATLLTKAVFNEEFKYAKIIATHVGKSADKDGNPIDYEYVETEKSMDPSEADFLISRVPGKSGTHYPLIDLDVPHLYIPSSQEGHAHLLITKEVTSDQYWNLLDALAQCGIVEEGYAAASKAKNFAAIRLPWVKKTAEQIAASKAKNGSGYTKPVAAMPSDPEPAVVAGIKYGEYWPSAVTEEEVGIALANTGKHYTASSSAISGKSPMQSGMLYLDKQFKTTAHSFASIHTKYKDGKKYSKQFADSNTEPVVGKLVNYFGLEVLADRFGVFEEVPSYVYVPNIKGTTVSIDELGTYVQVPNSDDMVGHIMHWPSEAYVNAQGNTVFDSLLPRRRIVLPAKATLLGKVGDEKVEASEDEGSLIVPENSKMDSEIFDAIPVGFHKSAKTVPADFLDTVGDHVFTHGAIEFTIKVGQKQFYVKSKNPETPTSWDSYICDKDGVWTANKDASDTATLVWYCKTFPSQIKSLFVPVASGKPKPVSKWAEFYNWAHQQPNVEVTQDLSLVPELIMKDDKKDAILSGPIILKKSGWGDTKIYYTLKDNGKDEFQPWLFAPNEKFIGSTDNGWLIDNFKGGIEKNTSTQWMVWSNDVEDYGQGEVTPKENPVTDNCIYGTLKGQAKSINIIKGDEGGPYNFQTYDPDAGKFSDPSSFFPWDYFQNLGANPLGKGDEVYNLFVPTVLPDAPVDKNWLISKAEELEAEHVYVASSDAMGTFYGFPVKDPVATFFFDQYYEPVAEVYGPMSTFVKAFFEKNPIPKKNKKPVAKKNSSSVASFVAALNKTAAATSAFNDALDGFDAKASVLGIIDNAEQSEHVSNIKYSNAQWEALSQALTKGAHPATVHTPLYDSLTSLTSSKSDPDAKIFWAAALKCINKVKVPIAGIKVKATEKSSLTGVCFLGEDLQWYYTICDENGCETVLVSPTFPYSTIKYKELFFAPKTYVSPDSVVESVGLDPNEVVWQKIKPPSWEKTPTAKQKFPVNIPVKATNAFLPKALTSIVKADKDIKVYKGTSTEYGMTYYITYPSGFVEARNSSGDVMWHSWNSDLDSNIWNTDGVSKLYEVTNW